MIGEQAGPFAVLPQLALEPVLDQGIKPTAQVGELLVAGALGKRTNLPAPPQGETWQDLYPTVVVDPTYGPTWATDNLERTVTATLAGASNDPAYTGWQVWKVTVQSTGSFGAFANPITGAPFSGSGSVKGQIEYDVTAPAGVMPSTAGLHGPSSPTMRSSNLALAMFGSTGAVITGGGSYQFDYNPIPGANFGPSGMLYEQVG